MEEIKWVILIMYGFNEASNPWFWSQTSNIQQHENIIQYMVGKLIQMPDLKMVMTEFSKRTNIRKARCETALNSSVFFVIELPKRFMYMFELIQVFNS